MAKVTSDPVDTGELKTLFRSAIRQLEIAVSHKAGPDTFHPAKA